MLTEMSKATFPPLLTKSSNSCLTPIWSDTGSSFSSPFITLSMTLGAYLSVRRLSFLTVHLQHRNGQCLQGDEQAIQLSRGQLKFAHSCSCKNSTTLRSFVSLTPSLVFDVLKSSIIALSSDRSLAGVWLEAITTPAADSLDRIFLSAARGSS